MTEQDSSYKDYLAKPMERLKDISRLYDDYDGFFERSLKNKVNEITYMITIVGFLMTAIFLMLVIAEPDVTIFYICLVIFLGSTMTHPITSRVQDYKSRKRRKGKKKKRKRQERWLMQ